jgi:hypothetical protein
VEGWLTTVANTVAHTGSRWSTPDRSQISPIGPFGQVLEQGALHRRDAEQVDPADEANDDAAGLGGVVDLHTPPLAGGRLPVGLPSARVAPYPDRSQARANDGRWSG